MKRVKKQRKPYWEMTTEELAEATREFDKPIPAHRLKPLSKAERLRFERAKNAGGPGVHRIYAIDLDPKLIEQVETYAKRNEMNLTQVIERGLRVVIAFGDWD